MLTTTEVGNKFHEWDGTAAAPMFTCKWSQTMESVVEAGLGYASNAWRIFGGEVKHGQELTLCVMLKPKFNQLIQ